MEKKVLAITLPTCATTKIFLHTLTDRLGYTDTPIKFKDGIYRHLHIIDKSAHIKAGDYAYSTIFGNVSRIVNTLDTERGGMDEDYKVVASTDPKLFSHNVPRISNAFLKEFVAAQGKGTVTMDFSLDPIIDEGFKGHRECPYIDKYGSAILKITLDEVQPLLSAGIGVSSCEKCNTPLRESELLLLGYCAKCGTADGGDDFPCQSDIEASDKCTIQCDHCYEYYAPLEVEQAARDWANKFTGDSWKDHLREAFEAGVEWAKANQKK